MGGYPFHIYNSILQSEFQVPEYKNYRYLLFILISEIDDECTGYIEYIRNIKELLAPAIGKSNITQ